MAELTLREASRRGGKATLAKYGRQYFKVLQAKRKTKKGKLSNNTPVLGG